MSRARRYVRVVIQSDGELASRTFRTPQWLARTAIGLAIAGGAALLLAVASYLPVLTAAARVPGLEREVERLERENHKIGELVAALDSAERRYDRIRELLGADVVPDPVRFAAELPVAPAIRARLPGGRATSDAGPTEPNQWPLSDPGYVTRGQAEGGGASDTRGEAHPGLDIAVPIGSPVRAAGGGTVLQAGEEAEYGRFVLLEHPGGYQSMYGHLSRITVAPGQRVGEREVVGLSGNTGRSSAPHLHFEIRRAGEPIDPRTLVKEQN
jgi:murein DD-endopeptidase MepM/ murein hydrolase activator NlpD